MRRLPHFALLAGLIAFAIGCGGSAPRDAARGMVGSDVVLDGVSILGAWEAVEVLNDPAATRDLESGALEMTLLIMPNGRATLTGNDHREGDARHVQWAHPARPDHVRRDGRCRHPDPSGPPPHPPRPARSKHRLRPLMTAHERPSAGYNS